MLNFVENRLIFHGRPKENPLQHFERTRLENEIHSDTKERLAELMRRSLLKEQGINRPGIQDKETYQGYIDAFLPEAKKRMQAFDEITADGISESEIDKIAKLTNIRGTNLSREGRNLLRTEVLARIEDKLQENRQLDPKLAGKILEKSLAQFAQPGLSTEKSLYQAMRAIPPEFKSIFLNRNRRNRLAGEMVSKGSRASIERWGKIEIKGQSYNIKNFEILAGASMTEINPSLTEGFRLKNIIEKNGAFFAQMENGCQGNLVILKAERIDGAVSRAPEQNTKIETKEKIEKLNDNALANFIDCMVSYTKMINPKEISNDPHKSLFRQLAEAKRGEPYGYGKYPLTEYAWSYNEIDEMVDKIGKPVAEFVAKNGSNPEAVQEYIEANDPLLQKGLAKVIDLFRDPDFLAKVEELAEKCKKSHDKAAAIFFIGMISALVIKSIGAISGNGGGGTFGGKGIKGVGSGGTAGGM